MLNDALSSDVKHCASENAPLAWTFVAPLGWMIRRPLAALQRSTGTYTGVGGRRPIGKVNAVVLVPLAIAPLSCTTPPISAAPAVAVPNGACDQPFTRLSVVKPVPAG